MDSTLVGVVTKKDERAQKTKYGTTPKVSLQINNHWYSTFVREENKDSLDSISEGDTVRISYVMSGEYRNITDTIEKVKDAASLPKEVQKQVQKEHTAASDKDSRIAYQAGVKAAVPFVALLIANDCLGDLSKAKKNEKADILEQAVHHYALRFAAHAQDNVAAAIEEVLTVRAKANGAGDTVEKAGREMRE